METKQTPKEKYEYSVPKEDIDGIKKASTAGFRTLMVICGIAAFAFAVLFIILDNLIAASSVLTAGIMILAFWGSALRSTSRSFNKAKQSVPEDLLYKIRIYDGFLVCERSNDEGIALLTTASLYDVALLGANDKYIVITSGVYSIPIPKELSEKSKFLTFLCALKGKKQKKPADAKDFFAEPRDVWQNFNQSPTPCEETPAAPVYAASDANPIQGDAEILIESGSDSDDFYANPQAEQHTTYTEADVSGGADSFKAGSFEAYDNAKANESSFPYAYESVLASNGNKRLKTAGMVTFVLSLLSIFAAMIATVTSVLTETSPAPLLIGISMLPVSSLVVGVVLLKKGESWLKNVLAAILALIVIISVDPSDVYVADDEMQTEGIAYVESVEQALGIDLPDIDRIYYYTLDTDNYLELSGDVKSGDYSAFIEYAKTNPKFISTFPNTHIGLLPTYFRENDSTVALVYNKTTGEYNSLPRADGTYRMIYITLRIYDDGSAYFGMYEYDLEYSVDFNR